VPEALVVSGDARIQKILAQQGAVVISAFACRLDGFDVRAWAAEDLLDILILGSGTIDIEVESFRELTQETHVQIYPCLYGWPSRYNPISAFLARGLAANYWNSYGANIGISALNDDPATAKRIVYCLVRSCIGIRNGTRASRCAISTELGARAAKRSCEVRLQSSVPVVEFQHCIGGRAPVLQQYQQ